jgi:hypothetical protein
MKKITILKLFITATLLIPSIVAFAHRTEIKVEQYTAGLGRPTVRTEPVLCFADKEAGYVEVMFRRNFGVINITVTDSNDNVVDETTIDTSIESFASLTLPDADDSYTVEIEGETYYGVGNID